MRGAALNPNELGPKWLPGRPLYYVAVVYAGLAYAVLPSTWAALAFGLCYLIWGSTAWGRWFDLGHLPDDFAREDVKPDPFESAIDMISFHSDHVALFFRHFLMLLPGLLILGYSLHQVNIVFMAPLLAMLIVSIYDFAWLKWPKDPIWRAEVGTGAVWGLMLLGASCLS